MVTLEKNRPELKGSNSAFSKMRQMGGWAGREAMQASLPEKQTYVRCSVLIYKAATPLLTSPMAPCASCVMSACPTRVEWTCLIIDVRREKWVNRVHGLAFLLWFWSFYVHTLSASGSWMWYAPCEWCYRNQNVDAEMLQFLFCEQSYRGLNLWWKETEMGS